MKGLHRNLCPWTRSPRAVFSAPPVRAMMVAVRATTGGDTAACPRICPDLPAGRDLPG
ncbi:MAG TPA: hypothetical protein VGG54_27870 [Trebonia sp.]|jgi:hypothetical protein